jgi:BirA family biotin operon repressor/biotin-[acetyl-CoA-carboxylase] ligase
MIPVEEWHLSTRRLGRRVLVYDCVDSTNTRAAALAHDSGNDGLVILADAQTAGRGQHGRSWLCTPGAGALLSVLLFPPPALRRPALLTAWAAVAVCETVRHSTGLEAKIKWPNDVLVHGKKVCGILIEQGRGTVVGIGLNVKQRAAELAAAGLPHAVSLETAARRPLDCQQLARWLIVQLDTDYNRLWRGELLSLEVRWRESLGLLGKRVNAECHDGTYQGRLRELAWEGLVLEQAGGETLHLRPEAVRHLAPA